MGAVLMKYLHELENALCAQSLEIEGEANLSSSVQIAQLALKHRQNKNQRQRIVIFIGSPLSEDKVRCFSHSMSVRSGLR